MKYWRILSYIFFTPVFFFVLIALTVINSVPGCLFDFHVGRINSGTFGAVLTSRCSGHSWSLMLFSCSISDSTSAAQSSSLSFGSSKSPFWFSQSSVSEMLWGELSSSLSTGWQLILRIWRTFNHWVRPPGRTFAEKCGGKENLPCDVNGAAPSCWKSDLDARTISSVSEIYPTAVIC